MPRGPRKPAVAIYGRISLEGDELRRKLESRLGISASKLIDRALQALNRELNQAGQPAG
jgi:hypothetical protein